MTQKRNALILLLLLACPTAWGQVQIGFTMPERESRVEVPFTEVNNLIVLPVVLNNFLKLNFILDTGVETPILTEMAFANLLGIEYIREVVISGPGLQDSIRALVGQKVNIRLPGNITGQNLNLLVLRDDYLKLSEKMGMDVHGIIGHDLFKKFIIEIDYDNKLVIFHNPKKFKPRKRDEVMPIQITGNKPYITAHINNHKIADTVSLLIDTGASHAVLLDGNFSSVPMPSKTIHTRLGTGLGGEIPGDIGRMDSFRMLGFEFKEIIISIPREDAYSQVIKRGSRQGTLGGDVLSRLHPTFAYPEGRLYLRKGQAFKTKFEIDMSGMSLSSSGPFLEDVVVEYVRSGSPAEKAGIQIDDHIVSINGKMAGIYPMNYLMQVLRKKHGMKVKVKVRRGEEKHCFKFRLERTI